MRAADYLAYAFADLHLEVIGNGPALDSLLRFREAAYYKDHLHLLGARADAAARLARADICWVPSRTATGRIVALEAMAAGRPVIATDLPHFREIIIDGVNGLFVPANDKTALARRSRQLFLDEGLRRRLGEAARTTVRDRFSARRYVDGHRLLYESVSSRTFPQTPIRGRFSIASTEPSRNNALEPLVEEETTGRHVS
jgi:glycosyltransferase involved in cell wall biosynthesis